MAIRYGIFETTRETGPQGRGEIEQTVATFNTREEAERYRGRELRGRGTIRQFDTEKGEEFRQVRTREFLKSQQAREKELRQQGRGEAGLRQQEQLSRLQTLEKQGKVRLRYGPSGSMFIEDTTAKRQPIQTSKLNLVINPGETAGEVLQRVPPEFRTAENLLTIGEGVKSLRPGSLAYTDSKSVVDIGSLPTKKPRGFYGIAEKPKGSAEKLSRKASELEFKSQLRTSSHFQRQATAAAAFGLAALSVPVSAVTHPIQFAKGIGYTIIHPLQTIKGIGTGLATSPVITAGELTGGFIVGTGVARGYGAAKTSVKTKLFQVKADRFYKSKVDPNLKYPEADYFYSPSGNIMVDLTGSKPVTVINMAKTKKGMAVFDDAGNIVGRQRQLVEKVNPYTEPQAEFAAERIGTGRAVKPIDDYLGKWVKRPISPTQADLLNLKISRKGETQTFLKQEIRIQKSPNYKDFLNFRVPQRKKYNTGRLLVDPTGAMLIFEELGKISGEYFTRRAKKVTSRPSGTSIIRPPLKESVKMPLISAKTAAPPSVTPRTFLSFRQSPSIDSTPAIFRLSRQQPAVSPGLEALQQPKQRMTLASAQSQILRAELATEQLFPPPFPGRPARKTTRPPKPVPRVPPNRPPFLFLQDKKSYRQSRKRKERGFGYFYREFRILDLDTSFGIRPKKKKKRGLLW